MNFQTGIALLIIVASPAHLYAAASSEQESTATPSISTKNSSASTNTAAGESRWQLGVALGNGLRTNPLIQSDDFPIIVDIDIAWFGDHFFFDNGDLGLTVIDNKLVTASVVARFNSDRVFFGRTDTKFVTFDLAGQPLATATQLSIPDRDYAVEMGIEILADGLWGQLQMTAHPGEPTAAERNEAHAAALANTILDNQALWDAPAIALGDLNASISSDTMRFLLEQTPLDTGASNPVVLNDAWDSAFPGVPYPARIDWILVTVSGLDVLDAAVISDAQTAQASDHEPVLATIAIDTTAGGSTVSSDIEPPDAPGNLSTNNVTDSSVALIWTASSDNIGVTGYRIYRDDLLLFTTAQLRFSDSGLQAATSYAYAVTAIDANGNESLASGITITTLPFTAIDPPATGGGGGGGVSVYLLFLLTLVLGCTARRPENRQRTASYMRR